MKEIVRVKSDNGVLAVKLPLEARAAGDFKQGDHMVWSRSRGGVLQLRTWKQEVQRYGRDVKHKST